MIPFISSPVQNSIPFQPEQKGAKNQFMDKDVLSLLHKGVKTHSLHEQGELISPIFLHEKRDGSFRLILNLKTSINMLSIIISKRRLSGQPFV